VEQEEEGSHDSRGLEASPTAGVGNAKSIAESFEVIVCSVHASIPQHERGFLKRGFAFMLRYLSMNGACSDDRFPFMLRYRSMNSMNTEGIR